MILEAIQGQRNHNFMIEEILSLNFPLLKQLILILLECIFYPANILGEVPQDKVWVNLEY